MCKANACYIYTPHSWVVDVVVLVAVEGTYFFFLAPPFFLVCFVFFSAAGFTTFNGLDRLETAT